jgi:flagellar biosynthesis/type III secretory pathway chaperone
MQDSEFLDNIQWQDVSLKVDRLSNLLNQEFDALKIKDLAVFGEAQKEKIPLLEELSQLAEIIHAGSVVPIQWQALQASLLACKDAHFRNIQLMQRQLDAVQSTLQILLGQSGPTTEVYDRSGQVRRSSSAWAYQVA